jgi:hypothetical protein
MKALRTAAGVLLAALLLGIAIYAVRVARHFRDARAELSEFKITQLDESTKTRLRSLRDKVFLTYFVSTRADLPSHMRDLERSVHDLFESMKLASDGLLDYQIIDPAKNPDIARYASNRKISPVRVRSVSRDSYSEKTVWSGVSISYGSYPPAIINDIEPDHLERLQALIVGHLNQMETPRLPVVAIAAPDGGARYKEIAAALSEPDKNTKKVRAKVLSFDFKPGATIPREADVLFWMEPGNVDPRQLRELNLFLESGRCAVVAGSEIEGETVGTAPALQLQIKKTGADLEPLLSEFGLHPVRELVLDQNCQEILAGSANEKFLLPYVLRVIGYNQDFRTMRGQPNGTLFFVTPTCMSLDAERLGEKRWSADLLATSSDKSWVHAIPAAPLDLGELAFEKCEVVAKQPVMVGLRNADPWHGNIIFCGATTPFVDGWYAKEGSAHWRLLRVLVDSLASDERLVQSQVGRGRLAPIPELTSAQRLLWRTICVFLFPVGLIVLSLARGAIRLGTGEERPAGAVRATGSLQIGLRAVGAFALAAGLVVAAGAARLRVDMTREDTNRLAPEAAAIASKLGGETTSVDLIFSSHEQLPPAMRPLVGRVRDMLREIARAGARLEIKSVAPDTLDARERAALEASGITPFKTTIQDEETTVAKTVYSALRLRRGGKTETLQFPDVVSFENLEFRLAFAMARLLGARAPHVAFASDIPRLTPAEDWDFTQAQLLAPKGADVYSVARDIVKGCDYRVTHVNPREPVIPPDVDLLIWFQPRRDVCKMFEAVATYLHHGGKVILAAQHFNMQSRQYRGTNFKIVYWPQPQFNDVDYFYFPDLGIHMVNEVLFDDLKTRMALDSQVNRSAIKEYRPMESALPFLVRAAAANFAQDSIITKNLGDQALLFSSFFESDESRLKSLGITAKPLIVSSQKSWSYAWKGGWIPDELLDWPPKDPKRDEARNPMMPAKDDPWRLNPRVPLAVLYEGNFPESGPLSLQMLYTAATQPAQADRPSSHPSQGGRPGKLLAIGCSEAFKNYRIRNSEFRADQFLLNSVAGLALDESLANVAVKRPVARGFEIDDPATKLRWRAIVLGAFPVVILLFGLLFKLYRLGAPVRSSI